MDYSNVIGWGTAIFVVAVSILGVVGMIIGVSILFEFWRD